MINHQIESTPNMLTTPSQRWHYLQTQATNPLAHHGRHVWTLVETQLAKHPFLQERPTFPHSYTHAIWYHILTHTHQHNTLHTRTLHQLTQTLNLPHETVRSWFHLNKIPRLQLSINKLDNAHQRLLNSYPQEALNHRLNPSKVYTLLKPLHDTPTHTPNRQQLLATAIQQLHTTHPHQSAVVFAELRPYHRNGPQWLRTIAQEIRNHLSDVQKNLNPTLNGKFLRIGIINSILYIWEKDENPDNWLNIYAGEHFHFHSPKAKRNLVETIRRHLLIQKQGLSRLISLLNNRQTTTYHPASRIQALHYRHSYLLGSSLHFLLDVVGLGLGDIRLARIGRGSQGYGYIYEPRFPYGEELNEFRARALAIILSDGSIDTAGILTYAENSRSRRIYVKKLFCSALGQIDTNEKGCRLRFPAVVGRIMHRWGVPLGDKILHAARLPFNMVNQNVQVCCAYLQEVIPEDGAFGVYGNRARFCIGRTKILDAGDKSEQYNFTSLISEEMKELFSILAIKNHRKKEHDTIAHFVKSLPWGKLKELSKSSQSPQEAEKIKQLRLLIRNNPPELLVDERSMIESLGIKCRMNPLRITLFETGRISVSWELITKRRSEALKWALMAPPSNGRKRKLVEQWLSNTLRKTTTIREVT